jgi:D-alanine-D-alanine ligase-like ATP-grasp enzyme
MRTKKRIGILRGGEGEHYDSSLRKGGEIISHILENLSDKYKTVDILIDKSGNWHLNGLPIKPADLVRKIDLVWNISQHPGLSAIINNLSIPNVENGSFWGILGNSSDMLRKHLKSIGVQMPRSLVLPLYQKDFDGPRERYAIKKAKEVFEKFSSPWVVKSFTPDSNMAIHLAKTFGELAEAIEDGVTHEKSILVEEFIPGKIVSMHSISAFRRQDIYVFPFGDSFGNFSSGEKEKLISLVKDLRNHIGAKHYLKSDFIFNPKGKVFLSNLESTPDLKSNSHFSKVCESVGTKTHHVVEHILERVLNKKT